MPTPPRICLVGTGYNSAVSTDGGVVWSYGVLPTVFGAPANGPLWSVAAAPFGYLAVPWRSSYPDPGYASNSGVAVSTDGITWTLKGNVDGVFDGAPYSNPLWISEIGKIAFIGTEQFHTYDGSTFSTVPMSSFARILQRAGNTLVAIRAFEENSTTRVSVDLGATWSNGPTWSHYAANACSDGTYIWAISPDGAVGRTDGVTWDTVATGGSFDMAATVGVSALSFGRDAVATSGTKGLTSILTTAAMPVTPDRTWELVLPFLPAAATPGGIVQPAWKLGSWMDAAVVDTEFWMVGSSTAGTPGVPTVVRGTDGLSYTSVTGITPTNGASRRDWTGIAAYEVGQVTGDFADTFTLQGELTSSPSQVFGAFSDAVTVAFTFAANQQISAVLSDMLVLFSDGSAGWPVSASFGSDLQIADGGAQGVFDKYNAINNPTQYSVDMNTGAVSIYTGYGFSQYTRVGQDLYAVRDGGGVYLLRGTSDAGTPIDAGLDLGVNTFGETAAKTVDAVFLGLDTDGEVFVRATSGGAERVYRVVQRGPMMRALLAKGVTDRAWGLQVDVVEASRAELDVVEVSVGINSRRWIK